MSVGRHVHIKARVEKQSPPPIIMKLAASEPIHYRLKVCIAVLVSLFMVTFLLTPETFLPSYEDMPLKYVGVKDMTVIRQKGHRSMMEEVCARIKDGYYVIRPPEEAVNSSLKAVVDHFAKVVYCDIAKVASTSWISLFKVLQGRESEARKAWYQAHPYPFYGDRPNDRYRNTIELGYNRLSRGEEAHRELEDNLPDPREEYYKFFFTRHPLDRLASAYLDKVVGKHGDRDPVKRMKSIAKYGDEIIRDGYANVTFEEFLFYVGRPDSELTENIDLHFIMYQTSCEPCSIQYDHIGDMDKIQADLAVILPHFNATDLIESFPRSNENKLKDFKYSDMYTNISAAVLEKVVDKYRADVDMFGYEYGDYLGLT